MESEKLMQTLYFRHACKLFDPSKKIPQYSIEALLEAARLSPSSFGMEPWRFIVIANESLKEELKALCWNQPQITSASHLVVCIAKHKAVHERSYYEPLFARRGLPKEALEGYLKRYKSYITALPSIQEWCEKQCYIAATNMMTYGAMMGIDSCPIEGFEKVQLQNKLDIKSEQESIALVVALGYRASDATPKYRLSPDEIISWIN